MKKLLSLCLAVALFGIVLVGCAGNGNEASKTSSDPSENNAQNPVTINFWYSANESNPNDAWANWQKENIALFKEKYGITIAPTVISDSTQYLTKISAEIAAGNAPDIFQTWMFGRLEPFVKAGRIEPLDDILARHSDIGATIPQTSRDPGTFDGKLYALPCLSSSEVIFYNKAIFTKNGFKVPETYDELLDLVKKCKEKGLVPMAMGNASGWLASIPYSAYFQRKFGNELYEKTILDKQPLFNSPEFVEAGKELAKMAELGMFTPNANAVKPEESQASFKEGRAAMSYDGSWRTATFYDALGEDLGFFNFPNVEGGKGNNSVWLKGYDGGLAISSSSDKKEAAEKFLMFMFTPERQKSYGEYGAILTTTGVELDTKKVSPFQIELNAAISKSTETYVYWDNLLGTNLGAEFNKATQGIIGGKDPAKMLETLNKQAEIEWNK